MNGVCASKTGLKGRVLNVEDLGELGEGSFVGLRKKVSDVRGFRG